MGSQGRPREEPTLSFRCGSNLRPAWRCDGGGARTAMDPRQRAGTSPWHHRELQMRIKTPRDQKHFLDGLKRAGFLLPESW